MAMMQRGDKSIVTRSSSLLQEGGLAPPWSITAMTPTRLRCHSPFFQQAANFAPPRLGVHILLNRGPQPLLLTSMPRVIGFGPRQQ